MKKVPEALILQGFLALLFSSTVKDRIIPLRDKNEKSYFFLDDFNCECGQTIMPDMQMY